MLANPITAQQSDDELRTEKLKLINQRLEVNHQIDSLNRLMRSNGVTEMEVTDEEGKETPILYVTMSRDFRLKQLPENEAPLYAVELKKGQRIPVYGYNNEYLVTRVNNLEGYISEMMVDHTHALDIFIEAEQNRQGDGYMQMTRRETEIKDYLKMTKSEKKEDRRLALINKLPPEYRDQVRDNQIEGGMTKEMVYLAWGKPINITETGGELKDLEKWTYSDGIVYFKKGVVSQWEG